MESRCQRPPLVFGSGSGKSTLMTTLAQRNPGEVMVDADIQYNGRPLTAEMRRMAGFVYQDDLFVGSLTVREHLEFAVWFHMFMGGRGDKDNFSVGLWIKFNIKSTNWAGKKEFSEITQS